MAYSIPEKVGLALLVVILAGCQDTRETVGYRSVATAIPGKEPDTYVFHASLTEIVAGSRDRSERTISAPTLTCKAGEPASIQVTTGQGQDGVIVTALFPKQSTGGTARCAVHLKKAGQTKYFSSFEMEIPEPQAMAKANTGDRQ